MFSKIFILVCCCVLSLCLPAQENGTISLYVRNSPQSPLPHATVELLKAPDTALIQVQVTDTAGQARAAAEDGAATVQEVVLGMRDIHEAMTTAGGRVEE